MPASWANLLAETPLVPNSRSSCARRSLVLSLPRTCMTAFSAPRDDTVRAGCGNGAKSDFTSLELGCCFMGENRGVTRYSPGARTVIAATRLNTEFP